VEPSANQEVPVISSVTLIDESQDRESYLDSVFSLSVCDLIMLATKFPTQRQRQLWVLQRLQRICSGFQKMSKGEPCLEQYEQQVQLMMDEEVTTAASAWIQLIVQSLRSGIDFVPEAYLTPETDG